MKIGLLPLYIELYDRVVPQRRDAMQQWADKVGKSLSARGFDVVQTPISRVAAEFAASVRLCEEAGAEAIVTLHLAYSPSLEAIDALAGTALPLLILNTTPDADFGFDFGDKVMANHGIHGVQDLCNLLLRRKKPFRIACGHFEHSNVLDELTQLLQSAAMARKMTKPRVGSVGGHFAGMGDFLFPDGSFAMEKIDYCFEEVSDADIAAEAERDRDRFVFGDFTPEAYRNTLHASLAIRRWVERERLDAFTVCFPGITRANHFATVPFLECSKAMARGIGYAGEGDLLTAALVGALLRVYPQTTFTEMFCPDWRGQRIFTSHMGEINIALTAAKPLLSERNYVFSDTGNPVIATGCLQAGKAALVNLAPGPDGDFTLIVAPVEFVAPDTPSTKTITGWFRPAGGDIAAFLKHYSELGGTHHLAAAYDADLDVLRDFSKLMNWHFAVVK
ncbi:MAG: L-arabinose isomerase family protein [Lentisphaeria bacterium]|jgi:L-arabinose isomerase